MSDFYTAADWLTAILVAVALAMIVLSQNDARRAITILAVVAALVVIRWTVWSFVTDTSWLWRAVIGALFGAVLLGGLPELWRWSLHREGAAGATAAEVADHEDGSNQPTIRKTALSDHDIDAPELARLTSTYDIQAKLNAIDIASRMFSGTFSSLILNQKRLVNHNFSETQPPQFFRTYAQELTSLKGNFETFSRELEAFRKEYSQYKDIDAIACFWGQVATYETLNDLANASDRIGVANVSTDNARFLLKPYIDKARQTADNVARWRDETSHNLIRFREELVKKSLK